MIVDPWVLEGGVSLRTKGGDGEEEENIEAKDDEGKEEEDT